MTTRAPSLLRRATAWSVLAAFVVAPPGLPAALAAPEGERVIHGRVDPFERDGDTTNIRTHSRRTIIRYTGFDILSHETVNIHQPDPGSRILNQVRSTSPTHVDGRLWSNGQVWIVNPVGVFVGGTAVVDVGGLVAAAGDVRPLGFLLGLESVRDLQGPVEVAEGARITSADAVLLAGRHVANYGSITAENGTIALLAGDAVRLARLGSRVIVNADPALAPDPERFAVTQAGTLDAGRGAVHLTAADSYSLAMNHTGITRAREIHAEGGDGGLVDVAGTLDATGEGAGDRGGTIHVLGDRIALRDATLDASGDAGGGDIRVGGDLRGEGHLRTASRTYVSDAAVLRADAGSEGDGGTVIVWADDATRFHGTLSARGGAEGGDGGFAEISGRRSLVARGDVDLGAPRGAVGTLLYDPLHIAIQGGVGDGTDDDDPDDVPPDAFLRGDDGTLGEIGEDDAGTDPDAAIFVIHESEIESTEANLVLEAGRSVRTAGTFADGEVAVSPGSDLTIRVTGADADPDLPVEDFFGIDLRDPTGGELTWKLSDGGRLTLSTTSTTEQVAAADVPHIFADRIETHGVRESDRVDGLGAVQILAAGAGGDVTVGGIDTSGTAGEPGLRKIDDDVSIDDERGGSVSIGSQAGDIRVTGSIDTSGADALPWAEGDEGPDTRGDGGAGGSVQIETLAGSIEVDSIDASGGDALARETRDARGDPQAEGRGGAAGLVVLVTGDLGDTGGGSIPPGAEFDITVGGNLTARGGDGLGQVVLPETGTSAETTAGAPGGSGGAIFVSAGVAEQTGELTLAPGIDLDASGGHGTAGGGSAGAFGIEFFSGRTRDVGAITVESGEGLATSGNRLLARGGNAGFAADATTPDDPQDGTPVEGSGGLGGNGGDVNLESVGGSVTLGAVAEGDAIVTDGGEGRIDADLGRLDGQGGSAGDATLRAGGADGAVDALAGIRTRGGRGNQGSGGSGGTVVFETSGGPVSVGAVDVSGGDGSGTQEGESPRGARGGAGGDIRIGPPDDVFENDERPASIALRDALTTLGGVGVADPTPEGEDPDPDADPNENHGMGGAVTLRTAGRLGSGEAGETDSAFVRARRIAVDAGSIAPGGSGEALVLAAVGADGAADEEDSVEVTVDGDAEFQLSSAAGQRFERVTLAQRDPTGTVGVSGSQSLVVQAGVGADDTRHRIATLASGDDDPHLTYRLLESGGTLVVGSNAGVVGANGAKLASARRADGREELLGNLEGEGAGPHVVSAGNLELVARNVGLEGQPLDVRGADEAEPGVELTVEGDVHLAATGTGAAKVARIDVQQRATPGDVKVALAGGDAVDIEGDERVDQGRGNRESMVVNRIDTDDSGVAFFYSLQDDDAGGSRPEEPSVVVASGALTLGAEAGLAGTGEVVLDEGADPAVDAGGHTLALVADADFDGAGAIRASDAVDVRNAGNLVLLAGEGVGSDAAPLRVEGTGTAPVTLAGTGGQGGFHLENAAGDLRVGEVELAFQNDGRDERASFFGIHADGDVVLDNGAPDPGRRIVLGAIQPDEEIQRPRSEPGLGLQGAALTGALRIAFGGLTLSRAELQGTGNETAAHVTSGGSQTYAGNVELENARTYESEEIDPETERPVVEALHEVRLVAGGDVVFTGDVDTSADARAVFEPEDGDDPRPPIDAFLPGSLEVESDGAAVFRGDVGQARDFGALVTHAARFEEAAGGVHRVDVERADFRGAVDGPDALEIRAESSDEDGVPDSRVTFRGDVGAGDALVGLLVDADEIRFDATDATRADRVVTGEGGIRLDTETPRAANDVPEVATIADTGGGLSLATAGDLAVGPREKLSVVGDLVIRAGGSVSVGDLSAASIGVAASEITVQGREPGDVRLPDGSTRRDRGTDWVANDIVTGVTPVWDGEGTRPTFVLGSGGIDVAGPLPFDVVHFLPGGGEVRAASFADGDATLDLTGIGGRVYAEPTDDIPRPTPPVAPALGPRFGDAQPAPAPRVSGAEVLAYLACRAPEGAGPCDAETARERLDMPSFAESALGTERAREIAAETHALVEGPDARARLVAAFAPVERAWRRRAGTGPVQGEALYRLVAREPALAEARAQLDRLAAVLAQVELLGLAPADTRRVQEAIARDFAEASGMADLDAGAVLAAAGTSPVGQLP